MRDAPFEVPAQRLETLRTSALAKFDHFRSRVNELEKYAKLLICNERKRDFESPTYAGIKTRSRKLGPMGNIARTRMIGVSDPDELGFKCLVNYGGRLRCVFGGDP